MISQFAVEPVSDLEREESYDGEWEIQYVIGLGLGLFDMSRGRVAIQT